jgi:hypothetical protein
MGEIRPPQKVLPVAGLIHLNGFPAEELLMHMADELGPIARRSFVMPFTHTSYYNDEMGGPLVRQWVAFCELVDPDELADLKLWTNDLEEKNLNTRDRRMVNIDPGIVTLSSLVLASTKNYSHRIYLGRGIYAEVTLIYKNNSYQPLEWTYPDYREPTALEFFDDARNVLKEGLDARKGS